MNDRMNEGVHVGKGVCKEEMIINGNEWWWRNCMGVGDKK